MNQVGSQYFECEFHSSGPFTDSGLTVFAGEVEDEIIKRSDGDVMILLRTLCVQKRIPCKQKRK